MNLGCRCETVKCTSVTRPTRAVRPCPLEAIGSPRRSLLAHTDDTRPPAPAGAGGPAMVERSDLRGWRRRRRGDQGQHLNQRRKPDKIVGVVGPEAGDAVDE